jgi:hypothetical protein
MALSSSTSSGQSSSSNSSIVRAKELAERYPLGNDVQMAGENDIVVFDRHSGEVVRPGMSVRYPISHTVTYLLTSSLHHLDFLTRRPPCYPHIVRRRSQGYSRGGNHHRQGQISGTRLTRSEDLFRLYYRICDGRHLQPYQTGSIIGRLCILCV